MRTIKRMFVLVLVLAASALFAPVNTVIAAGPPDTINSYVVTVTPQSDGTLIMKYEFDYTAVTDFPSGGAYLEVGVPNKDFTIQKDFGPTPFVKTAFAKTSGGSWVRLEFDHLPKAGENFKLNFTIRQASMAYSLGDDATFMFTPGWFDFAQITLLRIVWTVPTDASLISKLSPPPVKQSEGQVVWEATNLAPNAKFPVTIYVAKKAFDNLKAIEAPPPPAPGTDSGGGTSIGEVLFWLFVIVIVIIVVLFLLYGLSELGGGGGYSGGIGGYGGGGGGGGGGGSIFGGGGGGFSGGGGGSSGCACACACAGGGRAGCGKRLGFDVSLFLKNRKRQHLGEGENEK